MEPELFYWIGGATAVAALVVSAIGIKSESFPASRGIMAATIGIFVILVVGSSTYGVVNAQDEQEHREAELAAEQEEADEQELEAEETGAEGPITGDAGNEDVTSDEEQPEAAATDDGVVAMSEYAFGPDAVTVKQGDTVTAENEGMVVHNLTVVDGSEELAATPDVDGGDSADLEVDVDPGTYEMICTIPGHEDLGMVGEFTVE
jgi:plastocyanin